MTVEDVLREAGVSRNAYYTLARKPSVLPKSIQAIADSLGVSPAAFLTEKPSPEEDARRMMRRVEAIVRRHKTIDPDNVRHTLILLRKRPLDRLRGALRRGRSVHIQQ